jgi:two-component system chemotaxis response regulator CheY
MKAIVVDDSRAIRSILRTSLKRKGFEVVEAGDGKQALDYLKQNGPLDLALIDWNMPVMTGYELICALRGDHQMDSMPIMMVTTETEMVQVQKALLAGANEYVMKPFTEDAFTEKLLLLGFGGE